jgi:hypothetical protein
MSGASTVGQGKYMKYVSFLWPHGVAALSTLESCFLFTLTRKFISYLHVAYDPWISERTYPASNTINYNF